MKYRKKPIIIEASQWFKNGDHPLDASVPCHEDIDGFYDLTEGKIVKRYKIVDAWCLCKHCGKTMRAHGWIKTLEGGHIVCPGDWIITGVAGEHYPCKPGIFELTYEVANET